jgi:general secretion pathway protein N
MKRNIWLIIVGVLAFVGIIVARLPASWVAPGPSAAVTCSDIDGTIWNGSCSQLTAYRQAYGDLSWEVHPSRLLAGKLNASVILTRGNGSARAVVETGLDKNIVARDVHADLSVDPTLLPQLPGDLRGTLHADLNLLSLHGEVIRAVEGRLEVHDLIQGAGAAAQSLGGYSLEFPPGTSGPPVGHLRDLGGPLAVDGSVRLTPEPGFSVEGLVSARPTAPADLQHDIQFLGSPDAQGRRLFSFAATF